MSAVQAAACQCRPMQTADLDAVVAIESAVHHAPWTQGKFQSSLDAKHQAWVMTVKEVVIAYALMMVVLDEAELLNISVAPQHQGQGLGRLLLTQMIEQARALQVQHLFLEVRVSNAAAIALYQRTGFEQKSVRRGYYPTETGREDAIIMGLLLA